MSPDNEVTYLGEAFQSNRRIPFGIKRADRRQPLYVLGKTGMGKSTLLANIAVADIRAGKGVCVCQPSGDAHRRRCFAPGSVYTRGNSATRTWSDASMSTMTPLERSSPAGRFKRLAKAVLSGLLVLPAVALVAFGPRASHDVPEGRVIVTYWEKWTDFEGVAFP